MILLERCPYVFYTTQRVSDHFDKAVTEEFVFKRKILSCSSLSASGYSSEEDSRSSSDCSSRTGCTVWEKHQQNVWS